jgi:hypothetical protein
METLKKALTSKTVLFGLLLSIASAVQLFVPFFPQEYIGYAGAIIGAVIIILRFLTTVPVSEK